MIQEACRTAFSSPVFCIRLRLLRICEILYKSLLAHADLYVVVNLDEDIVLLDLAYCSVDTADSYDLVALLETVTESLKLLLLLSLRTDHEEPHNYEDKGEHDPH